MIYQITYKYYNNVHQDTSKKQVYGFAYVGRGVLAQLRVQFYEFLRRRSFWFSTSSPSVRFDHSCDSASSPLVPSAGASL